MGVRFKTKSNVIENIRNTLRSSITLNVLRQFDANIHLSNGNSEIATFYVVSNRDKCLMGKQTALRLEVLSLDLEIKGVSEIKLFSKIKNVIINLKIDEKVTPVLQPYRRIPISLEHQIEKKNK